MLTNIGDRSSQNNDTNSLWETRFDLSRDRQSKDRLNTGKSTKVEVAEGDLWWGIKAEKVGNLDLAAFYYRSALKSDPECFKAVRLLTKLLQKIRARRANKINREITIESLPIRAIIPLDRLPKNLQTERVKTNIASQTTTNKLEIIMDDRSRIAQKSKEQLNLNSKQPIKSLETDSNVNFIPVKTNLNQDRQNSSIQLQNDSILLPQMKMSPAGDLVLEDNLNVSQVYIEQALFFFEQKQWAKSITACQEALRLCSSLGEAYKIWGNCLQQSGNNADAIGIYAKALELQPNMAEIYCNLGSIYAKSQKWQRAIEYYQKSIIIDPNCAAPHRNLAKVWEKLQEYDKSEDCFFKALAIKPEIISAQNHFDLARNLAAENQLDRAIACYQHCIHLEPKFLNAYVRLTQLLEAQGKKEKALEYYRKLAQLQVEAQEHKSQSKSRQQIRSLILGKKNKVIPQLPSKNSPVSRQLAPAKTNAIAQYRQQILQEPNSSGLRWQLGNLYFQSRQWQNAISCYLKAIQLEPRPAKYYLSLGKAWSKAGDHIKANQAYYQGFSLQPEKIAAEKHLLLGNKLLEQRQIKPAIACYRRAITLQPELIEAYWQLGEILMSSGKVAVAIACYQQALKIDKSNSHSYFLLGNALTQNKQFSKAIAVYQQAAAIESHNADIWHNLGEAFYESQQWQKAISAYQRAIALNPDNSWSHNNLGNAWLKTEQWQPAADSFHRAIALKPDFVWSHYNLGEALVKLERWEEALTAYQNAQQLDPNLPEIKSKMGAILHRRSRQSQQEALSFCRSQLKLDPDNLDLYHQAISLDRKNHELYLGLGKALLKKEKIDEAISILQMGLEIQPQNLELTSTLSEAIMAKNPNLDLKDVALRVGNRQKSSVDLDR